MLIDRTPQNEQTNRYKPIKDRHGIAVLNRAPRQGNTKAKLICMCSTKAFEKTDDLLEDRYLKAERVMTEVGKLYEAGDIELDNIYKCRDAQIKIVAGKTPTHIAKKPARQPPPSDTEEKSEMSAEDDEGEEEDDEEKEDEKEMTPDEPEPSPRSPTDSLPGASARSAESDSSDFFALPACTGFSP